MPRAMRVLDLSDPRHAFASELRKLRDGAVRRPVGRDTRETDKSKQDEPLSVDELCIRYKVSRASIYTALSGTRIPSRRTLLAMVRAWAPRGDEDISEWMTRRLQAEQGSTSAEDASKSTQPAGLPDGESEAAPARQRGDAPLPISKDPDQQSKAEHEQHASIDLDSLPELSRLRLGTLLQSVRKRRGIPTKGVAYHCNVSYSMASAVLRGFSSPSPDLLERMLDSVSATQEERVEARRLLTQSKTAEQVYSRFSDLRNEEMIQSYLVGPRNKFWYHPNTWLNDSR